MKSINDEIYTALLKDKKELSNHEILREFFKIDLDNDEMATKIVEPLLKTDTRFKQFEDRTWTAVKTVAIEKLPVNEVSFILFYFEDLKRLNDRRFFQGKDIFSIIKEYSSFILYKGGIVTYELNLKNILESLHRYIFIPYDKKSVGYLKKVYRTISPLQPEIQPLSIKSLISVLFPDKRLKTWDDIVKEFRIRNIYSENPSSKTKTLRYIFEYILNIVREKGVSNLEELFEYSLRKKKKVNFSRYGFGIDFLKDIPEMPGVYLFFNKSGEVIYVGKTNNIKIRINSYFRDTGESIEKIEGILNQLYTIKYNVLGSDLEALLQEYKLINIHKPGFNKKMNIPERMVSISDKILLLPSAMEGYIKLYFISNKIPLIEHDFDYSGPGKEVLEVLKKIEKSHDEIFDPLKIIATLYLKRYEDRLNTIEIERYSSAQGVMNAIAAHCKNLDEITREKRTYI